MNYFITGLPGCGKSTLIKKIIDSLGERKIAGIITPEIREHGTRKGFKIIDLASGRQGTMSSTEFSSGPKVSKYGVSIENINRILDEFRKSMKDAEIIFLDELGPMEFKSKELTGTINQLLNSDKTIVAVLHRSLVKEFKTKGKIFLLSKDNFDEIKNEILFQLK